MDNELKAIIEGMQAENKDSIDRGGVEIYSGDDFKRVVDEYNASKKTNPNPLIQNTSNVESTQADNNSFLEKDLSQYEAPVISLEEFSIFKENDKGEDVELQVSNLINERLADKNITAKPTEAGDKIEVTLANGVSTVIPLFSEWNTSGALQLSTAESPEDSYEKFMEFINLDVDQQEADIYSKTGLMANTEGEREGLYDVDIQMDYDVNQGEEMATYSADVDQIQFLTENIEQEALLAFTSVSVDGVSIDYPGLEEYYNSFNLQNISKDTKENVKKAIYDQVSQAFRFEYNEYGKPERFNITYKEFSKIIGGDKSGLFTKTLQKLGVKQQIKNNRNSLSAIDLNQDFIKTSNEVMLNSLDDGSKKKKEYNDLLFEQYKIKQKAIDDGDTTAENNATLEIENINKDIAGLGSEFATLEVGFYGSSGLGFQFFKPKMNERLTSYFFNEKGMSDYRVKNATKGADDAINSLSFSLNGIKTKFPNISDRDALIKYYETKVVRYQQLMKEGDELIIKLDTKKFLSLRQSGDPEYNDLVKKILNGVDKMVIPKGQETIDVSINDIFDAGLDARDFDGIFDIMKGLISEKDVDLLMQYETTRDNNEGERRGLYELIYLNTNPLSMEKEGGVGAMLRGVKQAVMTDWLEQSASESTKMFSGDFNERAVKDHIQNTINNYNAEFAGSIDPSTGAEFQMINLTDDQIENLTRTFGEEVGEGVGVFTPMLIEMAGLNVATGGVLGYGQIGRIYQMFRSGNKFQKLTYHGFNVALEEAKMQVAFDMPVLGGTTFYTIGQLTSNMSPFNNTKFAALNGLWHKVVKSGVVGASSSQLAHVSEEAYNSFMNDEDFMTQFDDMYSDLDETSRRFLIDMVVFGITGFSHTTRLDYMGTNGKQRLWIELQKQNQDAFKSMFPVEVKPSEKQLQEMYMNPEKYLSEKQLKKYQQNIEFQSLLQKSYQIDVMHHELNPTNPNFEKNLKRIKLDPINESLKKEFGKDYKNIEIKFSENPADYANSTNRAQYDPITNTILIRKSSFKVGNEELNHEITHALIHAHFKNRPAAKKHFLEKMKSVLKTLDLKTAEGTKLEEAIEGIYKENVRLEEFTTYAVQILSNKQFYNQKAAPSVFIKIKQQFNEMLGDYGFSPKLKNGQDIIDQLSNFAQNPTNKKFKDLVEADIFRLETIVENNKVVDSEIKGARKLENDLLTLNTQKDKIVAENKRLANEKPEGYESLIKENSLKITEPGGLKDQIATTEGNVKNNEVNAKNITIYKEQVALKEQALKDSGLREELAKLKKEFPNGSSEITRLEKEIREFTGGHNKVALQRASNELYKNNEKLINEFVRDSFEAGGEITKDSYMSALNLEIALIQKSYDPLKNDNFGIYLRNTLYGKDYKFDVPLTDRAKPLRYGNVVDKAMKEVRLGGDKNVSFTDTKVLENMTDMNNPQGEAAYVQGENYSIGEGKLAKVILSLDKNPAMEGILTDIRSNVTSKGVMINGKEVLTKDLTYNNLTNLAPKGSGKDLFGKNKKEKAKYLSENWEKILQILPKNLNTITGEAGIVETVLLESHYKSVAESKRINIEQGNVGGVGNTLRELKTVTEQQFLAEYKIKRKEDGTLDLSGLDVKGKSDKEVLEIRAAIRKMGLLEGQILRTITNQEIRQEIANKVKNGDHELGKKVGVQTAMNQIRSGKNDIMATILNVNKIQEINNIEKFLLDSKVISPVIVAQALEQSNLSAAEKKIIGGLLFEIASRPDPKLTDKVVKKGLESAKEREMSEVELKEMEYVDQGKYNKLTDYLNKKYPNLKLTKDVYGELGENTITIEEMRVIDAKLIAMFPIGMPKELNSAMLQQFGIGKSRKINGERINMTRDAEGKTSFDLTVQSLTGGPRGNNGKKYEGEYDAVKITDPGVFKKALRKFREEYKGEDLNGDLYDFARKQLTRKGVNPKTKKPFTYEETVAANEKLRNDYMTGIYEMVRKTPEAELGATIQGILRHFQMQTNHGTGISKGTFSFTAISNMLPEMFPGKSATGYHAEHKLQIANYHANVVDIMLRNRNNPEQFKKELELLNKDAQQTMTKFADKMKYDSGPYGGPSGNTDKRGNPSYNVGQIKADITYLIERPSMSAEIVDLTGPRGSTLADKIYLNATKKDIALALSEIKKQTWTADIYKLEFKNNNRNQVENKNKQNVESANSLGLNIKGKNSIEIAEILIQENKIANEVVMASRLNLNKEFNDMMSGNYGIKSEATFSASKARVISSRRSWYKKYKELFVGSNADDFKGLTNYRLVNQKGKKGEQQQKFYDDALHIPYAMGVNALNVAKEKVQSDYKNLNKNFPDIKKILEKDIPGEVFSNENAIRVYLWTKNGVNMNELGLSKKDIKKLNDAVIKNPELQAYADQLQIVSGQSKYVEPDAFWLTQGIKQDLAGLTMGSGRDFYLKEFIENSNIIFSEANLNKLEVIHGREYRENLENSLYRMKKGTNRVFSKEDKLMNNLSDWTNGSVGVTMFLNTRSAVLQTLSATNYINFGANNPINAARAFANQPQYWKDFGMIFNSPMLKQRRGGLQTDVNHTELAAMSKKGGAKGAIGYLLTKGFLPTQLADSFAISAGGSTFYRNTFNRKIKEGLSVKEAEAQTWLEFTQKTQETQQSSDPSKISAIQSSGIGRLVFAFQNTPLQYTREIKKSALDLAYNRGDIKTNMSKIIYYGAAQNLIFGALQNALFTVAFDDDQEKFDTKTQRTLNGMFDTVLRGSGLPGAILATTKNTLMKFLEEEKKGFNADHAQTLIQAANFAPPVGIKARKLYSSMKGWQLNKNVIPHMGYSVNNPAYQIAGSFTAAATNFPLDRIVQKTNNVREILTGDHAWWQNVSLAAGYRPWDVGIKDAEKTEAITLVKEEKKIEKAKKKEEKKQEKKIEEKKKKEQLQKEQKKKGEELTCLECNRKVVPGKKVCTVHEKKEQTESGKEKQCSKIKKDKTRCKMMTANKSGKCYYHD